MQERVGWKERAGGLDIVEVEYKDVSRVKQELVGRPKKF